METERAERPNEEKMSDGCGLRATLRVAMRAWVVRDGGLTVKFHEK